VGFSGKLLCDNNFFKYYEVFPITNVRVVLLKGRRKKSRECGRFLIFNYLSNC